MLAGFPSPSSVEAVPSTDLAGHETRWLGFRRQRNQGNGRKVASGMGYGFRIKFPDVVRGPIALGYGAHFGLGLFVPECLDPPPSPSSPGSPLERPHRPGPSGLPAPARAWPAGYCSQTVRCLQLAQADLE